MKKHFIVSDLHMGDGSSADDFKINKSLFGDFLEHVKEQDGQLVLAGDVFELWQSALQQVLKANADLIYPLFALKPIIIPGNHDFYVKTFSDIGFIYYPAYRLEVGDSIIRIEHGHEHDPNNDPQRNMELGKLVAAIVGHAENWIHKDVEEDLMTAFGKAKKTAHSIWESITTPWKEEKKNQKTPDLTPFEKAAERLTEKGEVTHVVFGHTHNPDKKLNGHYFNSGSWVNEEPTFVEIDEKRISLQYFSKKGNKQMYSKSI